MSASVESDHFQDSSEFNRYLKEASKDKDNADQITRPVVEVSRPIFTEHIFQKDYERLEGDSDEQPSSFRRQLEKYCTPKSIGLFMLSLVPIITWLPKYKIKENLIPDCIGGVTVGISRIPIAMAYAILASLPAVYGLYVAFFPVLIYTLLGSSRHIAIGCEAVTAIMIASVLDIVVDKKLGSEGQDQMDLVEATESPISEETIRVEAASSLLLLVAIVQLGMFVFRLGIITTYFSEPLIRGFTNGACCHIFTSQFRELFGVAIPRIQGYFVLPKSYIELFSRLGQCNAITVLISVIAMVAMVIGSELLDYEAHRGNCRKKIDGKPRQRLLIPTDLIVVIIGLLASTFGEFADKYGVAVIGELPPGIPPPKIPSKDYFQVLLPEIVAIAIVGFAISYSAGKVYAKKYDYETDANQELMAYGTAGIISCFFNCYPFSTSMGRSGIQEGAGAKTQVASLVSCGIILLTLYVLAPLLSQLPKCVLAVMIILAMRGIFRQFADLPKLWKLSLVDFLVWVVTWVGVILLGVHLGLYIGVGFSLFSVIVRTQKPKASLMARVAGTDIYREVKALKATIGSRQWEYLFPESYKKAWGSLHDSSPDEVRTTPDERLAAEDLPGVRIFRFSSSLCFVNIDFFKRSLYSKVGLDPHKKTQTGSEENSQEEKVAGRVSDSKQAEISDCVPVHTIVIDCSMMAFIDVDGMQALQTIVVECKKINVRVFFSSANVRIQNTLLNSNILNALHRIELNQIYVTLHDAVEHALVPGNQTDQDKHDAGYELTSLNRKTSAVQKIQDDSIQADIDHLDNSADPETFKEDSSTQEAHTNQAFEIENEHQDQDMDKEDTKF